MADCPWTPRGRSGPPADGPTNSLQQIPNNSKDRRVNLKELDGHKTNLKHADSPRATGGRSAGPRIEQPEHQNEKSTSPIDQWISKTALIS
jgi:hypothetical protein